MKWNPWLEITVKRYELIDNSIWSIDDRYTWQGSDSDSIRVKSKWESINSKDLNQIIWDWGITEQIEGWAIDMRNSFEAI